MTQTKLIHIVKKIKAGHESAVSELMKDTMSDAIRIAKNILLNEEDIMDAVQDSYIKVWNNIDRFDPNKGKFQSWFYKIIQNVCIDHNRKQQYFLKIPSLSEIAEPNDYLENQLHYKMVKNRVLTISYSLPDKQREIFHLRDINGLSIEEVARKTGASTGSIKSNLYLARKKIKEILEKEEINL